MMSSEDDYFSHFHYHCLSTEESNNTLIPQMLTLGSIIHNILDPFILNSTISLSYGKRLIITSENSTITDLKRKDIIEIIDVDPVKKQVIYFGSARPARYAPLLYMIQYAKTEIQIILFLTVTDEMAKHIRMDSVFHIKEEKTFMDLLKSILGSLQTHAHVMVNNKHLILTGSTTKGIEESIKQVGETFENTRSG